MQRYFHPGYQTKKNYYGKKNRQVQSNSLEEKVHFPLSLVIIGWVNAIEEWCNSRDAWFLEVAIDFVSCHWVIKTCKMWKRILRKIVEKSIEKKNLFLPNTVDTG